MLPEEVASQPLPKICSRAGSQVLTYKVAPLPNPSGAVGVRSSQLCCLCGHHLSFSLTPSVWRRHQLAARNPTGFLGKSLLLLSPLLVLGGHQEHTVKLSTLLGRVRRPHRPSYIPLSESGLSGAGEPGFGRDAPPALLRHGHHAASQGHCSETPHLST